MATTEAQQQDNKQDKLVHFPISFFAVILGLCGLTLAWRAAGGQYIPQASFWLGLFASIAMASVSGIYLLKIIRFPSAVMEESRHPIRLNFFPAFSISLLLLAVIWQEYHTISHTLWLVGALVQICLTVYVISSWIHHTHYVLTHANPSWFIPVVGNIIAPIAGSQLGYIEISWFFFSIGIVFWIILLTIVMYRLFFHEPLPARLTPMLFILLAPPSIGFVSYTNLIGELDNFARVLFYVALFLSFVLFSNIMRFANVPFFISSWAYSFPMASLTIATAKMTQYHPSLFFKGLTLFFLVLVSILLFWLIARTIKAILRNEICVPE